MTSAPPFLGGFPIPDLSTGFTPAERSMVAARILAKCDALDGANDGIVADAARCQAAFSLAQDVPTCAGARDGTCLTTTQKGVIADIFAGAKTSTGTAIYSSFPFDSGAGGCRLGGMGVHQLARTGPAGGERCLRGAAEGGH